MTIIEIVKQGIGKAKQRQAILKRAKISDSTISRFLHGQAGLDPFALTRLFIAMDYTLLDKKGEKLIHKKNQELQIIENLPPAMQEEALAEYEANEKIKLEKEYELNQKKRIAADSLNDVLDIPDHNDNTQTQ